MNTFGINFQGNIRDISTIKGILNKKKIREQWNLLIGNKGEKLKSSRDQGNILLPTLLCEAPTFEMLFILTSA